MLNRIFFRPSHAYLPCEKVELIIAAPWGQVQVWREYSRPHSKELPRGEPQLYILRFLGSQGRAEMATLDPANRLPDVPAEVWTVNPPGFGRTTGPATFERYVDCALIAHEYILRSAGDRPVWVTGKSFGTAAALCTTARFGANALVLRNAMPLRELIVGRHGWWNLWLPALLICKEIPKTLDTIANASRCSTPAIFVVSQQDKVVPPEYQRRIIDAYAGAKEVLFVSGGHDRRDLDPDDELRYTAALRGRWVAA